MKKETYQDFASWWRTGHFRNCRYNLNQEGYQIFTAANGKKRLLKLKGIAWFDHNGCDDAWNGRYGSLWKHQKIPELSNVIIAFLTAKWRLFASGRIWCWSWWLYHKPIKPKLLVSKVKALLRRFEIVQRQWFERRIEINREEYKIVKDNIEFIT
jgi:two-component system alkaline phosphatase synthesis response regulator PhoP